MGGYDSVTSLPIHDTVTCYNRADYGGVWCGLCYYIGNLNNFCSIRWSTSHEKVCVTCIHAIKILYGLPERGTT